MKEKLIYLSDNMSHIVNKTAIGAVIIAAFLCGYWLLSGGFERTFMPPAASETAQPANE